MKKKGSKKEKKIFFKVYMWTISYLYQYRWKFALFVISGIVLTLVNLAVPKLFQRLIDDIIPQKNVSALLWLLAMFAILIVSFFTFTVLRQWMQRHIQEKAGIDLQLSLFHHLRKLGFSHYEKTPTGYTLSMFHTEVAAVQQMYSNLFPSMLERSVTVIISSILLFSINVKLSLIIIPCILLYFVGGPYFSKKWGVWNKEALHLRRETGKKLYDSISALIEVRAYGRVDWDLKRLIQSQSDYHRALLKQYVFSYLRGAMRTLSANIGTLVLFIASAIFIQQGSLTIGDFVAFSLYFFIVMDTLISLIGLLTQQSVVISQAELLYRFLAIEPEVKEVDKPHWLQEVKGAITFDRVSFGYNGQSDVIQHFNLDVQPGEKVAFVGSSGNGKSTLLKLVSRFYDTTSGEIRLDGMPISQLSFAQLRGSIGFVFQETYLFGGTIMDNIRFGKPEATGEEIIAAAKSAFAHHFIMEFPQGYQTEVGERGVKLSGGQKQRIAIARMFMKDPQIILLDEATSALDSTSEQEVMRSLDALLEGRTTIAVAHRLSTVQHFDKIVLVEQGQPAEVGRYEQLMEQQGAFYQLVRGRLSEGVVG
ncbi:ABC transporter ATP-binding protein [Paenibacillus yanchengensis]|uniref:ABC transporter ATP-binding protein n=1 Tax=Paenibacillus yanchengensis TaxID=2035833 RepID=A0ABW4YEX9_9BACL